MALHSIVWDASSFDGKPSGTDLLGQVDDHIKNSRQAVRMRFQPEHNFDLSNDDMQGYHKQGSARAWIGTSTPTTPQPDYSANETDKISGRLFIDTAKKQISVHNGTSWTTITPVITISSSDPSDGSDGDIWFKV